MKWFCSHDWTEWSELITPYDANHHQWRQCTKCKILKYHKLGYANGINAEIVNKFFRKIKE